VLIFRRDFIGAFLYVVTANVRQPVVTVEELGRILDERAQDVVEQYR
jgi:hypothetical protein